VAHEDYARKAQFPYFDPLKQQKLILSLKNYRVALLVTGVVDIIMDCASDDHIYAEFISIANIGLIDRIRIKDNKNINKYMNLFFI
jgi:hypothetical protein